ncbi:hypothetical protein Naga_100490g1 [Nannochloropsis gaditana]|uniref:Uncharacterized protein n=1 Tax=Nannochloropsis gaditana TaxID=72520 RepID=W7TDW2_9STRA|nr:hypothetical protein Naga_100490g1 [Nannochloropsis gaditana]
MPCPSPRPVSTASILECCLNADKSLRRGSIHKPDPPFPSYLPLHSLPSVATPWSSLLPTQGFWLTSTPPSSLHRGLCTNRCPCARTRRRGSKDESDCGNGRGKGGLEPQARVLRRGEEEEGGREGKEAFRALPSPLAHPKSPSLQTASLSHAPSLSSSSSSSSSSSPPQSPNAILRAAVSSPQTPLPFLLSLLSQHASRTYFDTETAAAFLNRLGKEQGRGLSVVRKDRGLQALLARLLILGEGVEDEGEAGGGRGAREDSLAPGEEMERQGLHADT